jgi:hypothetical protein
MNEDSIDATIKVMREISEAVVRKKIRNGAMPCPHCKTGTISWSYSGPRGFNFACSTPDCIRGMG